MAAPTIGSEAASVRLADTPDNYTADNIEGALAELAGHTEISGTTAISGDYTTSGDNTILVETSPGSCTITLASADASDANSVQVIDIGGNASANAIM